MDTNQFMIYNDLLYTLYSAETETDVYRELLSYLKMLIPSSYASLLTSDPESEGLSFRGVYCDPVSFTEAEQKYVELYQQDQVKWMMMSKESVVLKESDLLSTDKRLHSAIYQSCYLPYHIFDTMQMSIVHDRRFLGVVTLFHTKKDPAFTEADISLLKALGRHLNLIFARHLQKEPESSVRSGLKKIPDNVHLTRRETEILGLVYQALSNQEICEQLHITEHTLQKHLQNIYRKLHVSSRVELFQFCL